MSESVTVYEDFVVFLGSCSANSGQCCCESGGCLAQCNASEYGEREECEPQERKTDDFWPVLLANCASFAIGALEPVAVAVAAAEATKEVCRGHLPGRLEYSAQSSLCVLRETDR